MCLWFAEWGWSRWRVQQSGRGADRPQNWAQSWRVSQAYSAVGQWTSKCRQGETDCTTKKTNISIILFCSSYMKNLPKLSLLCSRVNPSCLKSIHGWRRGLMKRRKRTQRRIKIRVRWCRRRSRSGPKRYRVCRRWASISILSRTQVSYALSQTLSCPKSSHGFLLSWK